MYVIYMCLFWLDVLYTCVCYGLMCYIHISAMYCCVMYMHLLWIGVLCPNVCYGQLFFTQYVTIHLYRIVFLKQIS